MPKNRSAVPFVGTIISVLVFGFAALPSASFAQSGCRVDSSIQSLTPFPHITHLTASRTGCFTANAVASAMKTEWAAFQRFPRKFSTADNDGFKHFTCMYQQRPAGEGEVYDYAVCDGPNRSVVTMHLGS
jgi:hypothetical protein